MIPIVLILIIGFALGLTAYRSPPGMASRLLADRGGAHHDQLTEAYTMIVSGNFTGAASLATAVVRDDPENPLAYHILGLANARRGLTEEAALNFEKTCELDPGFAPAWYDRGIVEESRGEFARALGAYRRAAELEQDNSRYLDAVGRLEKIVVGESGWEWRETEAQRLFLVGVEAVNRGGPDDLVYAENIFRALLEDRPYDVAGRNMLGFALAHQGKLEDAERVFLQAVEAEPGYADAWYNLGMLHRAQGRLEAALTDFQTACSVSPLETFQAAALREVDRVQELLASETRLSPPPVVSELPRRSAPEPDLTESDVPDQ